MNRGIDLNSFERKNKKALGLLAQMSERGVAPNGVAFGSALKACLRIRCASLLLMMFMSSLRRWYAAYWLPSVRLLALFTESR